MGFGEVLLYAAGALLVVTIKRPVWLGGPKRRYTADDTANAMISRNALRSLAGYLIFAGGVLWVFGV